MTLEEAIKHCEEKANENNAKAKKIAREKKPFLEYASCKQCAEEHEQLAEWLKELKTLREGRPQGQWIIDKSFDGWAECNKCHYGLTIFEKAPNYCPNCGADMRKEGEP